MRLTTTAVLNLITVSLLLLAALVYLGAQTPALTPEAGAARPINGVDVNAAPVHSPLNTDVARVLEHPGRSIYNARSRETPMSLYLTGPTIGIEPVAPVHRPHLTAEQADATRVIVARSSGLFVGVRLADTDLARGQSLPSEAARIAHESGAQLISPVPERVSDATVAELLGQAADLIAAGDVAAGTGDHLGRAAIRQARFGRVELTAREGADRRYIAARQALSRQLVPRTAHAADVVASLRKASLEVGK